VKPVFADTSYYVALLSPGDIHHAQAVELSRTLRRPVVVTEFVLLELANSLSQVGARQLFVRVNNHLRSDRSVQVIPALTELFGRGCELYAARPDKDWSLTDCISFVVMEERDLLEALTADRHFEQAGFQKLLG